MITILLVADDDTLITQLRSSLHRHDCQLLLARNSAAALCAVALQQPALLIIDSHLPDLDGMALCRRLRDLTHAAIVVLSDQEQAMATALDAGADDALPRSFRSDELLARIHAQERIRSAIAIAAHNPTRLSAGPLTLDPPSRSVTVGGRSIALTPTAYALLLHLARHPGQVLDYRHLLTEVWGPDHTGRLDLLRLHIHHLRRTIEADPIHPPIIKTARGVGYYISD